MTNKKNQALIAGLDIGSTKVTVAIGVVTEGPNTQPQIEIVGVGTAPNAGIKQGVVVNIEATTEAIRRAREEAELMSGSPVQNVWVSVGGNHIKSFDSDRHGRRPSGSLGSHRDRVPDRDRQLRKVPREGGPQSGRFRTRSFGRRHVDPRRR